MPFGIGATGIMGLAFETTANTYTAPTKFFPFRSESLHYAEEPVWRRVIKGNVDVNGVVPGNVHVEGDIEIDAMSDVVPYFLYAARTTVTKTGAATPYTYAAVGKHTGQGTTGRTLSVTVVRNGIVFGYTGLVVSSYRFTLDNGVLIMQMSLVGSDEAAQTTPTATFANQEVFGAGQYNIQIPTATQIFDMDTFTLEVNDNAEPQYRLKNTGRGAQFIKFGERDVTLSTERDFDSRAEYDAFKALTANSVTIRATRDANNDITFLLPVAIKEAYEVSGNAGQGDLIRSSVTYRGTYDAATVLSGYKITVITPENIT